MADLFLSEALAEARRGRAEGGIPVGSVLVHGGRILGTGRNRRVQLGSVIRHAEMDALEDAGRVERDVYRASTMFTTLSPCPMCIGAIVLYGIGRVVIGHALPGDDGRRALVAAGVSVELMHDPACRELIDDFASEHPALWAEDAGGRLP